MVTKPQTVSNTLDLLISIENNAFNKWQWETFTSKWLIWSSECRLFFTIKQSKFKLHHYLVHWIIFLDIFSAFNFQILTKDKMISSCIYRFTKWGALRWYGKTSVNKFVIWWAVKIPHNKSLTLIEEKKYYYVNSNGQKYQLLSLPKLRLES